MQGAEILTSGPYDELPQVFMPASEGDNILDDCDMRHLLLTKAEENWKIVYVFAKVSNASLIRLCA